MLNYLDPVSKLSNYPSSDVFVQRNFQSQCDVPLIKRIRKYLLCDTIDGFGIKFVAK